MHTRYLLLPMLVLTALCITGCVAEDNDSAIDLGSVSIGNQLIDLKKARDAGAISSREYRELKADLLTLVDNAASSTRTADKQDSATKEVDRRQRRADSEDDSEEDEDSGFLF